MWAATGTLCALGYAYAYIPERLGTADRPLHPGPLTMLTTVPYVLAAVIALAVTARVSTTRRTAASAPPGGSRRTSADRRIEAPSGA